MGCVLEHSGLSLKQVQLNKRIFKVSGCKM